MCGTTFNLTFFHWIKKKKTASKAFCACFTTTFMIPTVFVLILKVFYWFIRHHMAYSPDYISQRGPLRCSGCYLLAVPQSRTKHRLLSTSCESRKQAAFSQYAPNCQNSFWADLREAGNIDIFKHKLKTHLFRLYVVFYNFMVPVFTFFFLQLHYYCYFYYLYNLLFIV